jgi:hypothetical protein
LRKFSSSPLFYPLRRKEFRLNAEGAFPHTYKQWLKCCAEAEDRTNHALESGFPRQTWTWQDIAREHNMWHLFPIAAAKGWIPLQRNYEIGQ